MGYKPTLGGLKRAQKLAEEKGHPLPLFQMKIRGDVQTVSLDEMIEKCGPMYEVTDVRLTNGQGDMLQFVDLVHFMRFTAYQAREAGFDVMIANSGKKGEPFKDFMDSPDGHALVHIARFGKSSTNWFDVLKFRLFPGRYIKEVFA